MKPSPRAVMAFAPGTWRWPEVYGSTRYHLWSLAKRGRPVLYVEPPHRWRLRPRLWSAPDGIPFHVLSPARVMPFRFGLVPSRRTGNLWRNATARAIVRAGSDAANHLSLDVGTWWHGAPWQSCIARLRPSGVRALFHVYDDLAESPIYHEGQKAILREWERELTEEADLVLCSSVPQLEKRKPHARRIEFLGNAISKEFIALCEAPPRPSALLRKLHAVERPRIAYSGVADLRLDPKLFEAIVEGFPDAQLAILGPIAPRADKSLAHYLLSHPRVTVFGRVPLNEYPALLDGCDVLILAHRRHAFTEAMYSSKLNEYLASGRPIVSIDLPEAVRLANEIGHPGALRIATSAEDFIAKLREALEEKDEAAVAGRRAYARTRTWEAEAEKLDRWIDELG